VVFRSEPTQGWRVTPERTGVLLQNGEWFEGEIRGVKNRKLQVSSVLYGMREFALQQSDVAMWRLCPLRTAAVPSSFNWSTGPRAGAETGGRLGRMADGGTHPGRIACASDPVRAIHRHAQSRKP